MADNEKTPEELLAESEALAWEPPAPDPDAPNVPDFTIEESAALGEGDPLLNFQPPPEEAPVSDALAALFPDQALRLRAVGALARNADTDTVYTPPPIGIEVDDGSPDAISGGAMPVPAAPPSEAGAEVWAPPDEDPAGDAVYGLVEGTPALPAEVILANEVIRGVEREVEAGRRKEAALDANLNEAYENVRTFAKARASTEAQMREIMADVEEVRTRKIDRSRVWNNAATEPSLLALIGAGISGLLGDGKGGGDFIKRIEAIVDTDVNDQLESLKREAVGLESKAGLVNQFYARSQDALQAAETARLAALQMIDDHLAAEMLQFASDGTIYSRYARGRSDLHAKMAEHELKIQDNLLERWKAYHKTRVDYLNAESTRRQASAAVTTAQTGRLKYKSELPKTAAETAKLYAETYKLWFRDPANQGRTRKELEEHISKHGIDFSTVAWRGKDGVVRQVVTSGDETKHSRAVDLAKGRQIFVGAMADSVEERKRLGFEKWSKGGKQRYANLIAAWGNVAENQQMTNQEIDLAKMVLGAEPGGVRDISEKEIEDQAVTAVALVNQRATAAVRASLDNPDEESTVIIWRDPEKVKRLSDKAATLPDVPGVLGARAKTATEAAPDRIRAREMATLAFAKDPATLPHMMRGTLDSSRSVQEAAVYGLGELGNKNALERLRELEVEAKQKVAAAELAIDQLRIKPPVELGPGQVMGGVQREQFDNRERLKAEQRFLQLVESAIEKIEK